MKLRDIVDVEKEFSGEDPNREIELVKDINGAKVYRDKGMSEVCFLDTPAGWFSTNNISRDYPDLDIEE